MKKTLLLSLFILSLTAFTIQAQTVQVTFQVDMTGVEVDPTGVYIAGGTVQPDNNVGLAMSDVNNDNIWTLTTSVPTNTLYLFKYRNRATTGEGDWDGFEEPDPLKIGGCTEGHYHDRFINVGVSDIVLDIVKYGSCDNNDAASTNHLGCLDSKATDYKPSATEQQYDNNGNVMCNYASCADIPAPGCIYETDGVYGAFVDGGFSADECEGYGGAPCDGGASSGEGCMNANATNYDASATSQATDQFGNLLCVFTSCDDVPSGEGCIYSEFFGIYENGFNAENCADYGGSPCGDLGSRPGCMDPKASNYNADATSQAQDQNGNQLCVYSSCYDLPDNGCIYQNSYAPYTGGFGAYECEFYGGNTCNNVSDFEASNLLIDFENENVIFTGGINDSGTGFDGGQGKVVENPFISCENSSSKVGKIVRDGGTTWAGSRILLDKPFNFTNFDQIQFKIFTSAPIGTNVLLKLEDVDYANNGNAIQTLVKTTTSNEWETLQFTYDQSSTAFDHLVLMFDFGNVGNGSENSTFYFDNFIQTSWSEILSAEDSNDPCIYGCMDENATNYDPAATFAAKDEYNNLLCAFTSCNDIPQPGCIFEYDGVFGPFVGGFSAAECTTYGGTPCVEVPADIYGCTYSSAVNYSSEATRDNGTCEWLSETESFKMYMPEGWSMFGFTCWESIGVEDAFAGMEDKIVIVKDGDGNPYLPEYGYNGLGNLEYARGYQLKLTEEMHGVSFCGVEGGNHNRTYEIGDLAHGGIVFYLDESGQHGLVAAMEDLEGTYEWGCTNINVIGTSALFGVGNQNTISIEAQNCLDENDAAQVCIDYQHDNFNDWYLPSQDELAEMFSNLVISGTYWSSNQNNSNYTQAWACPGSYGVPYSKNSKLKVRPIRAF